MKVSDIVVQSQSVFNTPNDVAYIDWMISDKTILWMALIYKSFWTSQ